MYCCPAACLDDRSDGLHWAVDPPASREDVREAVERGDLRAGSWRMVVGKERWDGDTRHVQAISELRDVSIVSDPAYPSAQVEYRAAPLATTNPTADDDRQKAVDMERWLEEWPRPAASTRRTYAEAAAQVPRLDAVRDDAVNLAAVGGDLCVAGLD